MVYDYEIVQHQKGLPFRAYFVHVGQINYHWHKDIELMLILKGSVILGKGNRVERLIEGEFRLLNSYEPHFLMATSEENIVLGLQIDSELTKDIWLPLSLIRLNDQIYNIQMTNKIRRKLCKIIQWVEQDSSNGNLKSMSMIYDLIHLMTVGQNVEGMMNMDNDSLEKDFDRLSKLVKYLNSNYTEKLTLQGVADQLFISKYHLSHFITNRLGVNFQNFLNNIRLQHAYDAIVFTDKRMIDIALENGFSDTKYMSKVVKETYNMTPTQLRISQSSEEDLDLIIDKDGHKPFDLYEAKDKLSQYI